MSEENEQPELLGFFAEDGHFIQALAGAVRHLIARPATTPEQIYHLAKLLFALNRLPRATSGFCIELALGQRHENGESNHLCLTIDNTLFRLEKTCYIILDAAVGGDTTAEVLFEVEGQSRDIIEPTALMDWVEEFSRRVAAPEHDLEISDAEDTSEIDWEAKANDEDWGTLESDYA